MSKGVKVAEVAAGHFLHVLIVADNRTRCTPSRRLGAPLWASGSNDGKLDLMVDCMACQLSSGDLALPGGQIFRTRFWLVEHCVGPLGLGTLIVKPERHVTSVADLSEDEAAELGPLLRRTSQVASQLVEADQVYNCLWSHAGGETVHIHYVVQPVTKEQMSDFGAHGPSLQVAMFSMGGAPDPADVERICNLARVRFSD